ncbi:MAG: hypothetical protein HN417_10300, partial [Desulfobacula sp.]|nr:hypothetical protein [Desulfobacula sp.]
HNGLGTIWTDDESESRHMDLSAPTWYELIDDQAQKINRKAGKTLLSILPGVEISTNGMHILAIFPPQKPRRQVHFMICDLLHELGFSPDEWGRNPEVGSASAFDTIELITRKGGLPMPAHIDGSDQAMLKLFKIKSGAMKDVLKNEHLSAVEIVNPKKFFQKNRKLKTSLHKWISALRRKDDLFPFAYFQGSDAHDLSSIAKRHTYVKMTSPSFSGLKTAIKMPSSRVRLSEFHYPETNGFFLHSLKMDTKYFGKRHFRFNRHMNCVTGRKGAGKTGICNMMRKVTDFENSYDVKEIILIVEKVVNSVSYYYAFCQDGKKQIPGFYSITPANGSPKGSNPEDSDVDNFNAEKLDNDQAKALCVKPKFYNASKIEELISSDEKLKQFLIKHFGKVSKGNAEKFNEIFAIPDFLEEEKNQLLFLEAKEKEYKLFVNTAWRKGKAIKRDFFDLSLSMRKTAIICMIIIMSKFGPTIISAPETDFDNRHITDFLVPVIKRYKDKQQVILFTNNPILAVNTDPDNYILLNSQGNKLKEIKSGFAIDDQANKEMLLNIVEGSAKAIKRRFSVYDL